MVFGEVQVREAEWQGAEEATRSVEACGYAEVETDPAEIEQAEHQIDKAEKVHSEIVGARFGTVAGNLAH